MASSILDPHKDIIISWLQDDNMKMSGVVKRLQTRLATVRSGPDCGLFWRLLKRPDCTVQSFVRLDWTVPKDRTVRRQ